ncbi:hypothetical protein MKX03_014163 [Papaver bracteatum]|nr:hypothetical protein MKX03_014163 [Papaver bracteatum]
MEKPAAERKYYIFNILHEQEEEQDRNSREGPESSSSEPLDAKRLKRMAQSRESSRTFRLRKKRIPCENSTITKEGSSSQEMFAAAGAVRRKVMSFSSPFPFFWTSMKPSMVGASFCMSIPLKFAREHLVPEVTNPDGVLDVLLQNEEGLSWEVLLRPNGLDQYTSYAGWNDFATDNKLKIGDCVIFELIDRLPDSTFAMNFHICRISVPVPSPVRVQESIRPREACLTHVPSSPLAREIKIRGRACENPTIRKGGSDNLEKFVSATAGESRFNSFSSPFPSFCTTVKPSNVFRVNIPVKFAREHLPTNIKNGEERMDHVLLRNVEGRSWELRASLTGCENYRLSAGWKPFATDNKLNIGDCVLFELIGRLPDARFVMNFHIYRVPVFVEEDLDDE